MCVCKLTLDRCPKPVKHIQVQFLCNILASNMPWLIFVTFAAYDIPQSAAFFVDTLHLERSTLFLKCKFFFIFLMFNCNSTKKQA